MNPTLSLAVTRVKIALLGARAACRTVGLQHPEIPLQRVLEHVVAAQRELDAIQGMPPDYKF